jgi:hypothetical protein
VEGVVFDVDPWGLHDGIDPEPVDTSVEPEPDRFVVDRLPAFLVLPVLCGDRRGKKSTKNTVCQPGEIHIIKPTSLIR